MFTEGLDESAKNWIKQGSDIEEKLVRSPLSERTNPSCDDHLLFLNNNNNNNNGFTIGSPHVLPPLKFHSALLGPHHTLVSSRTTYYSDDDDDDHEKSSVASAPDDLLDTNYYSDESTSSSKFNHVVASFGNPQLVLVEDIYGVPNLNSRRHVAPPSSMIMIRGGLSSNQNLRVQLPPHNFTTTTRFTTDCESGGVRGCDHNNSNSSYCRMQQPSQQFPIMPAAHHESMLNDMADLGTPSAPPMVEIGEEGTARYEVESKQGICSSEGGGQGREKDLAESGKTSESADRTYIPTIPAETESQIHLPHTNYSIDDHSTYYNTSGQSAWQTMIAYDACIRLCLYAWARGCTEAPEFLRDECLVLRSAFGLHNFLLQPQRVKQTEGRTLKNTEQTCPMKAKKAVGKIKVEVRKLRIIPRRKLKSTYSQRGAIFMQAGAEYVRHVSSVVKSRINSLRLNSFLVTSEDSVSCLFQLKSATEDTKAEQGSAICLHAGTGEYHVFFPESQGDALIVEVQDSKGSIEGRTTIPVSSLNDNPSDKIRWWPIYHDEHECIGKVQLYIGNTITFDETNQMKSSPVVETLAYDLLLEAAMRAQQFHSRNLGLHGPWKWLLAEFADYYGVSDSYTKLRYLTHVMNVATPTKDCLELVYELLVPITKTRSEKSLSRQEKSILLDCETQVESLLSNVFENYKSLDENSPMGLAELFGPIIESAAPALAPAVQIFTLLHDILAQDAQTMLRNYLQTAAIKRCRKHLVETEEFMSTNSESYLVDPITMATAYLKMKNICINISNEIKADIKIHNQHILPSSIDLSNIAAAVYSTELCNRLRGFLAALPPSSPSPHVNELLIATADFERDLESWNISPVQGGLDSKDLFHNYIMVWVQDMQLNLLDLCKAEKVPWSGVTTSHSTTPFAEEMYEKIKDTLVQYEVVINRWPQYSFMLETAAANVERAIIKALEKQYNDILTPLKDSIPKRLNVHVQKLTRRQSTALYVVPNQLGTFLNTIKRILDVLHCRVEDILKSWASCLPMEGDKKSLFGEQMNGITVLLRTKYKNFLQAIVGKLISNMQANRNTRLNRILEETREEDGEAEIRERMQMLSSQLIDSISNLHEVFGSHIFIAICRGFWDRMGETVLKFLEGRKENRVWYKGSFYALGILDDTFASQMQRLQGNALQEKDLEPPRSVIEARSILCRDTTNATDPSTYFYF